MGGLLTLEDGRPVSNMAILVKSSREELHEGYFVHRSHYRVLCIVDRIRTFL